VAPQTSASKDDDDDTIQPTLLHPAALNVLAAVGRLGDGAAQRVVRGDDHEGEDALGNDVHDGVGNHLGKRAEVEK